jgi:hypothetical protein
MREPPGGADLLRVAREVLRGEILPCIPEPLRYETLMILRAMAIAERELRNGEGAELEERDALRAIVGNSAEATLGELTKLLAASIRCGEYDAPGERRASLHSFLLGVLRQRLSETNPRYLSEGD